MQDQNNATSSVDQAERQNSHYHLVVVGAGIAGLNALHAASLHLPSNARVLLVDAKDRAGGMWTMAYDYVRLHQPHPLFTVGGLSWNWQKPRSYLAARDEVQQHLSGCLKTMHGGLEIEERFDHFVSDVREVCRSGVWGAEVDVHPNDAPEDAMTIEADRVIHAGGFDYVAPEPIKLSAQSVISITPADLSITLAQIPGAPVYVVGGGKTGMDTILAVRSENPERAVTLINGDGTY